MWAVGSTKCKLMTEECRASLIEREKTSAVGSEDVMDGGDRADRRSSAAEKRRMSGPDDNYRCRLIDFEVRPKGSSGAFLRFCVSCVL